MRHMFDLSLNDIEAELRAFSPDLIVVTTAPTYLFWRCAPPELRVPQQLTFALRDLAPTLVAVGPHGSTTPKAALRKLAVDIVVMGECEQIAAATWRTANAISPACAFTTATAIRVNGGPQAAVFTDQPAAALAGRNDPRPSSPPSPL